MTAYSNNTQINIIPGPHAPYTVSDDVLKSAKNLANKYHVGLQMHVHETIFEVETALKETGKRPIQRLQELGLLDAQFQAVHMTCLNEQDIEICKESGLSVIHCPESNLKLASGFAPIKALVEAGVNIGLGTDGAASNNDLDLFGELRTASLIAKASSQDPSTLNASQSLKLATINSAKALGMHHQTGSLEVGKDADIIAIDISQLEQQPHFDTLSLLTYSNIGPRVSHSFIQGKCLLDNYQFSEQSGLNAEALISKAKYWQERIEDL